jgi:hypothetical protein
MMTRRQFHKTATAVAAMAQTQTRAAEADRVENIGSRRELFVDHTLIGEMRGVELRLAIPVDGGPALSLDRPWEGNFSNYTTILKDGDTLRMYYRGTPGAGDGNENEVTCCAESRDGIHWARPDLSFYEVRGQRVNNVIMAKSSPFSHNFTPFLDTRPGTPASQRYKAVAGYAKTGLVAFVSANGLKWTRLQEDPVLPAPSEFALDSQNIAFWSSQENQYVLYYRTWKKIGAVNYRWTSRAVSKDFLKFVPTGEMEFGDAPPEQLYTNQTSQYFRAPHIYVGICARFMPGRQVLTEEQAKAIQVNPAYFKDCSDAVLLSSRGGNHYDRTFMDAILRPGVGMENWVSRSNYPSLNLFQTGPATMSFLVNRNYGQPTAYLRRYDLRLDGFASAHAGYAGGHLTTSPIVFDGAKLELNYSTSAAGFMRVELLDHAGAPIPGFTIAESHELVGDEIDRAYNWKHGADVTSLRGKPVRVRFHLKDADLYAYRFA